MSDCQWNRSIEWKSCGLTYVQWNLSHSSLASSRLTQALNNLLAQWAGKYVGSSALTRQIFVLPLGNSVKYNGQKCPKSLWVQLTNLPCAKSASTWRHIKFRCSRTHNHLFASVSKFISLLSSLRREQWTLPSPNSKNECRNIFSGCFR